LQLPARYTKGTYIVWQVVSWYLTRCWAWQATGTNVLHTQSSHPHQKFASDLIIWHCAFSISSQLAFSLFTMAKPHQDITDLDQETQIQLVIDQLHVNSVLSFRRLAWIFNVLLDL
jgi:hypothetical protein